MGESKVAFNQSLAQPLKLKMTGRGSRSRYEHQRPGQHHTAGIKHDADDELAHMAAVYKNPKPTTTLHSKKPSFGAFLAVTKAPIPPKKELSFPHKPKPQQNININGNGNGNFEFNLKPKPPYNSESQPEFQSDFAPASASAYEPKSKLKPKPKPRPKPKPNPRPGFATPDWYTVNQSE